MAHYVPEYNDLLTQLGYDYNSSELIRFLAFKNALSSFVEEYVSFSGRNGNELDNWQTQSEEFTQMAQTFLNEHHKGDLFWPDDNEHLFANRLKYTTNYKQILCLMAQLFYRRSTLERSGMSHKMDFILNASQSADRPPCSQGAEQRVPSEEIKVRYNVLYEDESGVMNCSDWCPEPGFRLDTLDGFLCKLPGGQSGMGIKLVLSGLRFRVTRSVFDDTDLERVIDEFDRCVAKYTDDYDDDMPVEVRMITVDIVLDENKPTPFWIFS